MRYSLAIARSAPDSRHASPAEVSMVVFAQLFVIVLAARAIERFGKRYLGQPIYNQAVRAAGPTSASNCNERRKPQ